MLSETVVVFLICLCGGDSADTGHSVRTLVTHDRAECVCMCVCKGGVKIDKQ